MSGKDIFNFNDLSQPVLQIVNDITSRTLQDKKYLPNKVTEWMDGINSQCLTQLKNLSPNFKYVVSTIILQVPCFQDKSKYFNIL